MMRGFLTFLIWNLKMIKFIVMFFLFAYISELKAQVYFANPVSASFQEQFKAFSEKKANLEKVKFSPLEKYFMGFVYFKGASSKKVAIDQDKEKGVKYFLQAWREGVSDAGYVLAQIYYHGVGVTKDIKKSKYYLVGAAEQGLAQAQSDLGIVYWGKAFRFTGIVDVDVAKAEYWLMTAASQGYGQPAASLSKLSLSIGKKTQAFKYAQMAIEPYNEEVKLVYADILAELYEKGIGTEKDFIKAYKYYDLTGTAGTKGKVRVAKSMTDAQIQKAIQQSRTWQEEYRTFVPSYYGLQHQSDGSYR